MSQQTNRKRSSVRPQKASPTSSTPSRPQRLVRPTAQANQRTESAAMTKNQPVSTTVSTPTEPTTPQTPTPDATSATIASRSTSTTRLSGAAHTAWHKAQHEAMRAERVTRLNEIAPDIQQFLIATLCTLLVGVLYLALPQNLLVGPSWLLLVVEVAFLAPPSFTIIFQRRHLSYRLAVTLAMGLLFVITAALVASVILLIAHLGSSSLLGPSLLKAGGLLWVCNVLVFAVWYWESDGNGPRARVLIQHEAKDFRFPQQEGGNTEGWRPGFLDYLFLAFCSATALSPADTMPLTQRAKLLMMAEAVLSMLIIVLLVARSVNIL